MVVYCKYGGHTVDPNKIEVYEEYIEIGPDMFHFPVYICEDCADELEMIENDFEVEHHARAREAGGRTPP